MRGEGLSGCSRRVPLAPRSGERVAEGRGRGHGNATNRFHSAEGVAEREALDLLRIFDLDRRADDYAKNLPYGDQRRLEIARALAARPTLLLLDEPTAALNVRERHVLMETIHNSLDK